METSGNIVVGSPDVRPSTPSHTLGVREGNQQRGFLREPGIKLSGRFTAHATARRSTGINAEAHRPIDPRMPVLTPA
jgi:hypothetical protein